LGTFFLAGEQPEGEKEGESFFTGMDGGIAIGSRLSRDCIAKQAAGPELVGAS